MTDPKVISEIASRWKNIDPNLYEKFIALLKGYTEEITVAVTEAPSSDILQAQGRAQQARKFLQLFVEVREPTRPMP